MINPGSQLPCTSRAEWQLQTGRPAKPLSQNYRLNCDFGTAVIIPWKEGGGEPIYVCDSHAKQLGRSRDHGPEAYIITAPSEQSDSPAKRENQAPAEKSDNPTKQDDRKQEDRTQNAQSDALKDAPIEERSVGTKSDDSVSLTVEPSLPDTKAGRTLTDTKVGRAIANKPSARDLTFGNAAKAMVDEAIWNMAAGGQLAVIHRKIEDYTLKLEAIFSKSQTTINVEEFIDKPLEQAVLGIIDNQAMSDSEKDAAIQQLGALQEWVKQGLHGEITSLQANQIVLAIGDRLDWGRNSGVSEEVKPVYRALYGTLKTAICKADPEAQNLHDRLTNLYAAKSEIAAR
jgi:hypothetical protein